MMSELASMEERLVHMEGEKARIKSHLESTTKMMKDSQLDEDAFRPNDQKVSFYTGLPRGR